MLKYDFCLKNTDEKEICSQNYRGKNLIVYFYPKANTPGWTSEAKAFMEYKAEFDSLNTVVIGISRDKPKANKRFKDNNNITFELLSDEDSVVCNQYEVIAEKSLYGKKYMGLERSTFIFDESFNLVKEYRNVKVKGHVELVLKDLYERTNI